MTKWVRITEDRFDQLHQTERNYWGEGQRELELLEKVIDALGLREAYPTTQEPAARVVPIKSYFGTQDFVQQLDQGMRVTYGATQFKADVLAAAGARKGEAAVARLRAAMKERER